MIVNTNYTNDTNDTNEITDPIEITEKPKLLSIPKPHIFEYIEFNKYEDAYRYFNINPDKLNVKIVYSPNSLEIIHENGNIITIIGEGIKSSPGYPSGNQVLERQMKLINHFNTVGTISVFYKNSLNKIIYMGRYGFLSYKKKLSSSGFAYFEFTLNSYQPRDRYKVFDKPNIPLV